MKKLIICLFLFCLIGCNPILNYKIQKVISYTNFKQYNGRGLAIVAQYNLWTVETAKKYNSLTKKYDFYVDFVYAEKGAIKRIRFSRNEIKQLIKWNNKIKNDVGKWLAFGINRRMERELMKLGILNFK